jgi:hypothetical protein
MFQKLIIFTLVLMLVSLGIGGCQEFGCSNVNYIAVSVNANVCVAFADGKEPPTSVMWSGAQVKIEIIKAGGERVQIDKYTDSSGCTETVSHFFEVYKEQPVQVKVRPIYGEIPEFAGGGYLDYSLHTYSNNVATLLWSDIYPANDFGDSYIWDVTVSMLVQPNS